MHEFHGRAKRTVPSSVEDTFALITDVDRLPEWNRAIETVVERPAQSTRDALMTSAARHDVTSTAS